MPNDKSDNSVQAAACPLGALAARPFPGRALRNADLASLANLPAPRLGSNPPPSRIPTQARLYARKFAYTFALGARKGCNALSATAATRHDSMPTWLAAKARQPSRRARWRFARRLTPLRARRGSPPPKLAAAGRERASLRYALSHQWLRVIGSTIAFIVQIAASQLVRDP